MEQKVARGGHGPVPTAIEGPEGVQFGRPRSGKKAIPGRRTHSRHDGQPTLRRTETNRPGQSGEVGEQVVDYDLTTVVHRQNEDDRTGRERGENRLGHRRSGDGGRALRSGHHNVLPCLLSGVRSCVLSGCFERRR
jgi:hypothetical protein